MSTCEACNTNVRVFKCEINSKTNVALHRGFVAWSVEGPPDLEASDLNWNQVARQYGR